MTSAPEQVEVKVKPADAINSTSVSGHRFVADTAKAIVGDGIKKIPAMVGKTSWIANLNVAKGTEKPVNYVFASDVIVDTINKYPKADYVYVGIPKYVCEKVQKDVAAQGFTLDLKYKDGYFWTASKIKGMSLGYIVKEGLDMQDDASIELNNIHSAGKNIIGYAVMNLRLKCTCPETVSMAGVASEKWSIGASVTTLMVRDTSDICSEHTLKVFQKTVVKAEVGASDVKSVPTGLQALLAKLENQTI